MTTTRLHEGRIPIPEHIREAVHLDEGDEVEIRLTDEGILLRPVHEPDLDLSWFETPEGKARRQKAVDAVRSGEPWVFDSGEEFVATLERLAADDADM